jgi:hypothetical protein
MIDSSDFRTKRMPLNRGGGHRQVLGFGTLIPDAAATISATRSAIEAGFRHFDYEIEIQIVVATLRTADRGGRISTAPLFRKTRSTKSIVFEPDRGSMK